MSAQLFIKRVNYAAVEKDYLAGKFATVTDFPPVVLTEEQENELNTTVSFRKISHSREDGIFLSKDVNNEDKINVCTNQVAYEIFCNDDPAVPLKEDYPKRCRSCLRDFKEDKVSIPIRYALENAKHIFWCEDTFCSFECALFWIRMHTSGTYYSRSESYLRLMFCLQYGNGKKLLPANDPRLLKSNGGSLTDEEFTSHRYVNTENIICAPIKIIFTRI